MGTSLQAAAMLKCEICGEEIMLEEDMKTHLLPSHMENDSHCPFCSLSGVSHDELCFHISTAHAENQEITQEPAQSTSSTARAKAGSSVSSQPETSQSCSLLAAPDRQNEGTTSDRSFRASAEAACTTSSTGSSKTPQRGVRRPPGDDTGGTTSQHNKAKQRHQPSAGHKQFSCPVCLLECSSSFILQEHVELHLQEHSAGGDERFECPMCSVVCSSSWSLQEHVELHLDSRPGSPGSSLKLARKLQQELDQQRKEDEARQEREDFKKLQRQFGLDGSGGYRRQMERTMERDVARGLMAPAEYHCKRAEMMESLASGLDDGRTRTAGVMGVLYQYYQAEAKDCTHVWLSAASDHYHSSAGDHGWGCGYRNLQMMLSSLYRNDAYAPILAERAVPSIPRLQSMIEEAWKGGLDPQGASHFSQRLQGTRAWIGATEIYVLLTSLGISARIIDFHQPTGPGGTHPLLLDWVKQYFSQSSRSSRLPRRLIQTSLPPIYLQHQGHSRSIVGLEQRKNGSLCLLLLDPDSSPSNTRKLMSPDTVSTAIRHLRHFPCRLKHEQYQVVAVEGVLTAEDKRMRVFSSRTLCAERIP
ncbi:zinc finger-containing ubiquitin peptidase 1 [Aulostomus maculatus]